MINKDFIKLLEDSYELPEDRAAGMLFAFVVTFRHEFPALDVMMLEGNHPLFNYVEFRKFSDLLVKYNPETGRNEVKVPMFGYSADLFEEFVNLLEKYNVNYKGHINNQLSFSIFSKGNEDRDAFLATCNAIKEKGEFELDRLARCVAEFYQYTEFPTKLCNFLGTTNCVSAYVSGKNLQE